jgi:spore coat protein U-like protein
MTRRIGLFILILVVLLSSVCNLYAGCSFTGSGRLQFGNLDPGNPVDVSKSDNFTARCNPAAIFMVTDDDGLNESGPNLHRMKSDENTGAFLPYQFTYSASPASAVTRMRFDFTGVVKGTDYQNAYKGNYSDTITLTINP